MKRNLLDLLAIVLVVSGPGCEDGGATADTGHDAADAPWDAVDGLPDAGDVPTDDTQWVNITLTGARTASWIYNGDDNYIYCLVMSGDTLVVRGNDAAGGDHGVTLTFGGYGGPGTYDFTYSTSDPDFKSVEVRDGEYGYQYFYDFSRIDFHDEFSHCHLVVDEDLTGPAGFISGTLDCEDLWARISSPDYEDDPVEFQPTVDLAMSFRCGTL